MEKKYELMVIFKPLLPENVRLSIQKKIEEMIKKGKGTVRKIDVWGKKHLAYKIKGHSEGYYIIYNFDLSPKEIPVFKKELDNFLEILRYLLIIEN